MGARLLVMVCLAACITLAADAPKDARSAAKRAEKAQRAGDLASAFELYKEAVAKDPANSTYIVRRELARQAYSLDLMKRGRYAEAAEVDPTNDRARTLAERAAIPPPPPAPKPVPPSRSTPADEDVTPPLLFTPRQVKLAWNLRGDTKALYLAVGAAYGIHFDFEDEVQPVTTHLVMEETDFAHVVMALGMITRTFTAPLAPKIGIVAQDISVKHLQYEHTVLRALDVTELQTPEAINEAANLLRTVFDMRQVTANTARKEILVRDELTRVEQADAAIHSLIGGQAQVMFEFKTMQVSNTYMRQMGILPTQQYTLTPLATHVGKIPVIPGMPAVDSITIGGGTSLMAITPPQATISAMYSDSHTRSSNSVLERASDNQPATFTLGVRYPIVTAILSYGQTTTTGASTAGSSVPSFQYVDLGVKVKVTPHVHGDGDITVNIEATTTALGAAVYNSNPTIDNREVTTQVRLKDGETAILAGMFSRTDTKTLSGLPGVLSIIGLQSLLGQRSDDHDESDVMMVITPHLLRMGASQTQLSRTLASPEHAVPVLR